MRYIIISFLLVSSVHAQDYEHLNHLSTMARINGENKWIPCPKWNWNLIPPECKNPYMIAFNCLPRCGKYPGDKPDIGAYEYFPGITSEKPWGDWNGIPLTNRIQPPKQFKFNQKID